MCLLVAACGQAGSDGVDDGLGETETAASDGDGEIGDAESRYLAAIDALTGRLYDADCDLLRTLAQDYEAYAPAMTNARLQSFASTRFKPQLDYMARKACNQLLIDGDAEAYKQDAVAASPSAGFLSGSALLQALVDQSSDLDALLASANDERSAAGLEPIIVADYPNSVVGGPTSTIVFFPGWPDRPALDQWLQVQRTLRQMFFITLEPRDDGSYASFVHARPMRTTAGTTTIDDTIGSIAANDTCLLCHYSGKPIHMRAPDDPVEAAKVATLVEYLAEYPARTNHPDYNPFPNTPGLGTGGTLTLEEASTYAGRDVTADELVTLNRNTACDNCHDDSFQNALRPPFSEVVEILMENGLMPPGVGVVDAAERAEALQVMKAAYVVELARYFQGE
jgi:hypothetical protein